MGAAPANPHSPPSCVVGTAIGRPPARSAQSEALSLRASDRRHWLGNPFPPFPSAPLRAVPVPVPGSLYRIARRGRRHLPAAGTPIQKTFGEQSRLWNSPNVFSKYGPVPPGGYMPAGRRCPACLGDPRPRIFVSRSPGKTIGWARSSWPRHRRRSPAPRRAAFPCSAGRHRAGRSLRYSSESGRPSQIPAAFR